MHQLPESVRRRWQQLSDGFYKGFCSSKESPVERYPRLKHELNAAVTKANVVYHSASGCHRHVNQFLNNLWDRELQLSLQGRVYFTMDELEDVLKQVKEMERGRRRKPANDVQFGRHKPQGAGPGVGVPEPQVLDPGDLGWEDEDHSGYQYQYDEEYDEENDEAYDGLVDQGEAFCAEVSGALERPQWTSPSRPDCRESGYTGFPRHAAP
ncbi:hypothetical protein PHMEG_00013829 [Phytophthora megakarya]|uniref:Uncharacterized protein n=1 Tax=Phytophthora megakarya TaxID=4795 RepID=A0A225W5T0_9STRA|nr:hypothetical protein PHMEG_00013829 [Phytophthora megakarya]